MDLEPVHSTALEAVAYDPAARRLTVRFTSGKVYDYYRVPERVYAGLLKSPSKGAYFNSHIKDRYSC